MKNKTSLFQRIKNEHILNTAVTNGFDKKLVDKKITTFRRIKHKKENATLFTLDKDVAYKKSLLTIHGAHNKFHKIFKHRNIVLMPKDKYCNKYLFNSRGDSDYQHIGL